MNPEKILLVNENDEIIGEEEKVKCHAGDGLLHRAFLVMLYDEDGRLILGKRSPGKMLWPDFWDGTVASHVHRGETYKSSARSRLIQEMGIHAEPEYLFKFRYQVGYGNAGSENEICAVLKAEGISRDSIRPNPEEISEITFIETEKVFLMDKVAPWLIHAVEIMKGGQSMPCRSHEY